MNPFDNVGTTRISASVYDRMCRLAIGYQPEAEEADIVALRTGSDDRRLIDDAVALTRATRTHPATRMGASVRGAIDLVLVADQLTAIRGGGGGVPRSSGLPPDESTRATTILNAALLALSGRITLDDTADTTPEQLITELWQRRFGG
jgi:MoxR-like ATPase